MATRGKEAGMENYSRNSTVQPSNRPPWWVWVLGAIVVCICLGCAGTIGGLVYLGREPENFSVDYSMPPIVKKGENFDLVLTLTNSGAEPITVTDIDLDEILGDSILDGAIALETDPPLERDYSVDGIKTFQYNQTLQAGETKQVIFHLQATTVGEFGGSIGIYVGDIAKRLTYVSLIVQE
jgi:hypothetical protein